MSACTPNPLNSESNGFRLQSLTSLTTLDIESLCSNIPIILVVGSRQTPLVTELFKGVLADQTTKLLELEMQIESEDSLENAFALPVDKKDCPLVKPNGSVTIGRKNDTDICIDHKSISRHHAQIIPPSQEDEQWFLQDTGSLNGTYINGVRLEVHKPYRLNVMDEVLFGEVSCRFIDSSALKDLLNILRGSHPNH